MSAMATPSNKSPLRSSHKVFTSNRFSASSLLASDSDLSAKPYPEDEAPRRPDEHRPHPRKPQQKRKFIDPECAIEDITPDQNQNQDQDQDQGYDADEEVDGDLPTETEEPDSESEAERGSDTFGKQQLRQNYIEGTLQTPASLISDFGNLRCGPGHHGNADAGESLGRGHGHRVDGSQGNVSLKRSHSEDSLTDTDEDASEGERQGDYAPENHRLRRRVKRPDGPLSHALSYDGDYHEQMDIDKPGDRGPS